MEKELKQAFAILLKKLRDLPGPMKVLSGCLVISISISMFLVMILAIVSISYCTSCSNNDVQETRSSPAILTNLIKSGANSHPDLTPEKIKTTLIGKNIPFGIGGYATGVRLSDDGYQAIEILQQNQTDSKNTVVINLDSSNSRGTIRRTGRLRLHYDWIIDEWHLEKIDNISFVRNPAKGFPSSAVKSTNSLPPLNREEAAEAVSGLHQYISELKNPNSADSRRRVQGFAGYSLSFLEKRRLPKTYIYMLSAWSNSTPAPKQRANYAARALTGIHKNESAREKQARIYNFEQSCKSTSREPDDAIKLFSFSTQVAPSQRADYIYRACRFKRYRFVYIREMTQDINSDEMWLVFAMLNYLQTNSTPHDSERSLLMAMLTGKLR